MFGQAAASPFAAKQPTSLFGTPATSTATSGLFGTPTSTAATGGSLFGAAPPASSAAPSLFAAAPLQATSATAPLFTSTSTAGTGLFGAAAATQKTSLFGTPAAATTASGLFGAVAAPTATTSTGGLFCAKPPATGLFAPTGTTSLFSQPPPALPTQGSSAAAPAKFELSSLPPDQQNQYLQLLHTSMTRPQLFGDERDEIMAKFNQLQAFAGKGTAYYSAQAAAGLEITEENPFCRFKSIVYSRTMGYKNEDGVVALQLKRSAVEARAAQQTVLDAIFKILGANTRFTVRCEGVRPMPDNHCEFLIFVVEQQVPSGLRTKMLSTQLHAGLTSPNIMAQLTQQLACAKVVMKFDINASNLDAYVNSTPFGMDPLLWKQAMRENPDPRKYVPVQVLGFAQLRKRKEMQREQAQWQQNQLEAVNTGVTVAENKLQATQSRIAEYRIKQDKLAHRLLKILTQRHTLAQHGYTLTEDEERLQALLDRISTLLVQPMGCRARQTELLAQVRAQPALLVPAHLRTMGATTSAQEQRRAAALVPEIEQLQSNLDRLQTMLKEDAEYLSERSAAKENTTMLSTMSSTIMPKTMLF